MSSSWSETIRLLHKISDNNKDFVFVPHKKSFTLIELLVVIAIIAILMGMLIPGLASLRGLGLRISCISNLKQLGQLQNQYVNSYDIYAPTEAYHYVNLTDTYANSFKWYVLLGYMGGFFDAKYNTNPTRLNDPKNWENKAAASLMYCPKYPWDSNRRFQPTTGPNGYFVSYFRNKKGYSYGLLKQNKVKRPSQQGMFFDGGNGLTTPAGYNYYMTYCGKADYYSKKTEDDLNGRHDLKINYVCYDGHCETIDTVKAHQQYGAWYSDNSYTVDPDKK